MALCKFDVEDFGKVGGKVSSESDTYQVRYGEQITALRILKWRRHDAAGNIPPTEISALMQGDTKTMSAFLQTQTKLLYNNMTAARSYLSLRLHMSM